MNILLAVHQFFPDFFTGTEVLTLATARELAGRGHKVSVVTGFPVSDCAIAERFDEYEYEGIPVRRFRHNYTNTLPPYNVMESEYRNTFFGERFSKWISARPPDIVHIFHLMRLSGALVDACHASRIPMVFTPTDFWAVCPTSRLLLPDHSFCPGPARDMSNCLRHIIQITRNGLASRLADHLPDRVLGFLVACSRLNGLRKIPWLSNVRALSERREYMTEAMGKIDRILFPTKIVEQKLGEYGIGLDNSEHLPFGMELGHYKNAPEKVRKKRLRFGYIGSLVEHKGVHVLIDAIRRLPAEMPLEASIYGNPDEFPDYAGKILALGGRDPRIRFCGTFPHSRIGDVFSEIDILVVPSIWFENTPLVLYSAQASKTPVIGSRLEGISEVVSHGKNGMLFEKGDAGELAKIMANLCGNRELVEVLSRNSVEPLSVSGYTDRLLHIYEDILKTGDGT